MTSAQLYKQLGDWFLKRPQDLLPKAGMGFPDDLVEQFKAYFDPNEAIELQGFNLQGEPNKDQYETVSFELINLPLIVAYQAGVRGSLLLDISKHQPIDVKDLFDSLDAMMDCYYSLRDCNGDDLSLSELYLECMGIASEAFPDELLAELNDLNSRNNSSRLNIASTHSQHPEHWPSTRLSKAMQGIEQGTLHPEFFTHVDAYNITGSMTSDKWIPKDSTGVRYDLFLERSGMLLPEVATKKIGSISLWEDMLDVAKDDDEEGMSALFNYCLNNPPEHLRPGIMRGLSGMALASSRYLHDGSGLYKTLSNKVDGTWLEPLTQNLHLIISLMGTDNNFTPRNLAISLQTKFFLENHGIPVKVQHKTLLEHCLKAVLDVPVEEMGVSNFQIYLLDTAELPEPEFSEGFKPEPIIIHMLKSLEDFSVPEAGSAQRGEVIDEFAVKGCTYVIQTLSKHFPLDYQAFAGMSSKSVRVLAEAGLDKRRLPRMNHRDRGQVLSQELGL